MWAYTMDLKLMADDVALAYRRANFKVKTTTFFYSFPQIAAAALNTRAFQTLAIDTDSLFVVLAINHRKQHDIFMRASAGCGLKITDLQNSYTFGEVTLVPSESIAGSGEAPSVLPFPYILAPGSRVRADIIHLAGNPNPVAAPDAKVVTVSLTLVGIKLITAPFTRTVIIPEC